MKRLVRVIPTNAIVSCFEDSIWPLVLQIGGRGLRKSVLIVDPFAEGEGIAQKGQADGLRSLWKEDFLSIRIQVDRKGPPSESDGIGQVINFVLSPEITTWISIVNETNTG